MMDRPRRLLKAAKGSFIVNDEAKNNQCRIVQQSSRHGRQSLKYRPAKQSMKDRSAVKKQSIRSFNKADDDRSAKQSKTMMDAIKKTIQQIKAIN
jgi:hypothetical protein